MGGGKVEVLVPDSNEQPGDYHTRRSCSVLAEDYPATVLIFYQKESELHKTASTAMIT